MERGVFSAARKGPDITGESQAEILAFEDERILEDLDAVVGHEAVAERGCIEAKREKDENGEMEWTP